MFGNIMEMMGKLQGVQESFKNLKSRLDGEVFTEKSSDQKITITLTKLATIKDIQIDPELRSDSERLEDTLVVTLNKALETIKNNAIEEAKKTAKESLPSIPGMPF